MKTAGKRRAEKGVEEKGSQQGKWGVGSTHLDGRRLEEQEGDVGHC